MDRAGQDFIPVNIISGFLGAGKTTFINQMLKEGYGGPGSALIENEFGDIAIDSDLIETDSMDVRTLAQGCICCTLKIDFVQCLRSLVNDFNPNRIIIEPTGIAGASEVVSICALANTNPPLKVESVVTIVDATELEEMLEFEMPPFLKQLAEARFILLSRSQMLDEEPLSKVKTLLAGNCAPDVTVVDGDWREADVMELLGLAAEAFEQGGGLLAGMEGAEPDVDFDVEGHRHDHGHEHHHHHAHEVEGIISYAFKPEAVFDESRLDELRAVLERPASGIVLRAKGFLRDSNGQTILFEKVRGDDALSAVAYDGEPKFIVIGKGIKASDFEHLLGRHCHR